MSKKKGTSNVQPVTTPTSLELSYNDYRAIRCVINTGSMISNMEGEHSRFIYFKPALSDNKNVENMDEYQLSTLQRTVVAIGIPVEYNADDIREMFEMFGAVESTFFRLDSSK